MWKWGTSTTSTKITIVPPDSNNQIKVNEIKATITPKTGNVDAQITVSDFKKLYDELKKKDSTLTEEELKAELKKQDINNFSEAGFISRNSF